MTQKFYFVSIRVESIVEKGENADYQHFLLSHNVFKGLLSWGRQKSGFDWIKGERVDTFLLCFRFKHMFKHEHMFKREHMFNILPNETILESSKFRAY